MRIVNRTGRLKEYRALPLTSIFNLSTGLVEDKTFAKLDDLEAAKDEKLGQLEKMEDSLTID